MLLYAGRKYKTPNGKAVTVVEQENGLLAAIDLNGEQVHQQHKGDFARGWKKMHHSTYKKMKRQHEESKNEKD